MIRATVLTAGILVCLGACRAHAPDWGPTTALMQKGTLQAGGRERSFVFFTPGPSEAPRPLVLALHGRMGDGAGQEKLSGISRVAAREGFVVVAPDGVDRSWADARAVTPASKQGIDDLQFLSALIDFFIQRHGADPKAVYVIGMSNGAMMSLTVACGLADKVKAVVAVTGLVSTRLAASCQPSRPVSVAFIVGDQDPLVPFGGGQVAGDRGELLSAAASVALWRKLDGCSDQAQQSTLPDQDPEDGTTTELHRYQDCNAGAEVALFTVRGGGHTWPGGWKYLGERLVGRTAKDFSASDAAWAFFARHRR